MARSIWGECGGKDRIGRIATRAWRAVEAQHIVSTRKLVDSDAEQEVLEDLIEGNKPPLLRVPELRRLHYLLATSFRYPPLRHGSRFGTRGEPSIWYGSEALSTLFSEVAYYRFVFLEGTSAVLPPLMVELSTFRVAMRSKRGVDLTRLPFDEHRGRISSKTNYLTSQRLGRELRGAGVEVCRYISARDSNGGTNIAVFHPGAFAETRPAALETWLTVATKEKVEVSRKDFFRKQSFVFERRRFDVNGRLPTPAE